jgi:hypothetical protein
MVNLIRNLLLHMYDYVKYDIAYSDPKVLYGQDVLVADKGECMDPEGNGVNPGEGNGGGPGPPSGERDKQLISNSGGDNTLMGQPGRQEDE